MNRAILAGLLPITMLAACGTGGDPDESIAAIRQTELSQLQSIESDDLVGIARLYRDDAKLVTPEGEVFDGGVAIVDQYGRLLEDPNFSLTIEPGDGWASTSGDLAVVTSQVTFTTTDPASGEAVTTPLTSQTVWHRETGATWKIVSSYNIALAQDESAPAEEPATEAEE